MAAFCADAVDTVDKDVVRTRVLYTPEFKLGSDAVRVVRQAGDEPGFSPPGAPEAAGDCGGAPSSHGRSALPIFIEFSRELVEARIALQVSHV